MRRTREEARRRRKGSKYIVQQRTLQESQGKDSSCQANVRKTSKDEGEEEVEKSRIVTAAHTVGVPHVGLGTCESEPNLVVCLVTFGPEPNPVVLQEHGKGGVARHSCEGVQGACIGSVAFSMYRADGGKGRTEGEADLLRAIVVQREKGGRRRT